jgi:hypothetical protein
VTGYGSGDDFKAPAGWEEPFTETNNYAVFRAVTGERAFWQIDDNQDDPDVAAMASFDAMASVTTGTGNWFGGTAPYRYLGKRYNGTSAYSISWIVVADEKTCYVFLNSRYGLVPHGFGEYDLFLADTMNSLFFGHGNSLGLGDSSNNVALCRFSSYDTTPSTPYFSVKDFRDNSGSLNVNLGATGADGVSTFPGGGGNTDVSAVYPGGRFVVSPFYIVGSNTIVKTIIGQMRGIYYPISAPQHTDGAVVTIAGADYLVVHWQSALDPALYKCEMLIKLGSWD